MQQKNETFDSDCDDSTNKDTSHILSVGIKTSAKSQIESLSINEFDFDLFVQKYHYQHIRQPRKLYPLG